MDANGNRKGSKAPLERIATIAHEHISHARRNPGLLKEIGERIGITPDLALAVAISDHVCEEFVIVLRN